MRNKKRIRLILPVVVFILVFGFLYAKGFALEKNLVSNVDGKIRVIILHNGDYGSHGSWFDMSVFFRDLMDKMDKDVAFVIVVGNDLRADKLKEALKSYESEKLPDGTARLKYLTVAVKTVIFYPYARDAYFIQADSDNNLVFLDAGYNEQPFPILNFDDVFAGAGFRAGIIHRGGGNVRATDEELIIGMDTFLGIDVTRRYDFIKETLYSMAKNYKKKDVPLLKKRLAAHAEVIRHILAPGKKLVIPGLERFLAEVEKGEFKFDKKYVHTTGAQAAYHTDVYLGLGHKNREGKRVLFIADSNAGAEIVKKMPPGLRREVERNLPAGLVEEGINVAGIPVTYEQIAAKLQWEKHKLLDLCMEKAAKTAKVLDGTAKHLAELGYHVVRIPYLPNGLDNSGERKRLDPLTGISFNYSNVLFEVYDNVKKVYMPRFGFKQLDEAAAGAYRAAGFQVVLIKGPLTTALTPITDGAGIDCLTSEIRFPVRWAPKYYSDKKK